jgi:hypothetical protein
VSTELFHGNGYCTIVCLRRLLGNESTCHNILIFLETSYTEFTQVFPKFYKMAMPSTLRRFLSSLLLKFCAGFKQTKRRPHTGTYILVLFNTVKRNGKLT